MREMKDSGIEWIGEIPKDWNITRFRYLHKGSNVGNSIDKEFWTNNKGDTIFYTAGLLPINTSYTDFPAWKYTEKEDLLLARNGTPYVYYPPVGAAYSDHIIRVSIYDKYDKNFIRYCIQQSILSEVVDTVSIATWSVSLWDKQYLPLPKLEIQQKIADFLDEKCTEIDNLTADIQKQIDTLEQYKKSVITEAVTKGLNPDVEMKDSGVEWIGEIPKRWDVIAIKRVVKYISCGVAATPKYVDEKDGVLFLSAQNIQNDKLDLSIKKYIPVELHKRLTKNVKPEKGDVLQVRVGASIGKTAIVDIDEEFSIYVSLTLIKVNEKMLNTYMKYYLSTNSFRKNAELFIDFAGTQGNLNVAHLKNMKTTLPSIEEQQKIADYLDEKCSEIDLIISDKKEQLETLEQYKKSLIYEYVTGKKEVM